MPPRNFQQTQPITTTLRTILGLYAPSSCLRELVQNADDARASEVEFVLDTSSYVRGPLLHNDLKEYQGPALIAWNDSCFTELDFQSLASVGDSVKQNDITSTGKFGLGFNSVFHWTDNPSILSGDTLLLLDPHHSWSASDSIGQPGGPAWNIVDENTEEIRSHLAAFSKCQKIDPGRPFKETMIRIPLRTATQALTSKIKSQESTVDEIKKALEEFSEEITAGGLLFLKNVRSIRIKLDGNLLLKATILQDKSNDTSLRNGLASDFLTQYGSDSCPGLWVSRTFKTSIQYETTDSARLEEYLVQSLMAPSCKDSNLNIWARRRKVFPWVAVAAPLTTNTKFVPSLFSILRLPIRHSQPIHIHSLFAISQDRKSILLEERDESTQWNRCVSHVVAECYVEFLKHLASNIGEGAFHFWPRKIAPQDTNTLSGFVSRFSWEKILSTKDIKLFPLRICNVTTIGPVTSASEMKTLSANARHVCTSIEDSYFDFLPEETSSILASLFEMQKLPVVKPPTEITSFLHDAPDGVHLKQLDSLHLSKLFKEEAHCSTLEKFLCNIKSDEAKVKAYTALLRIIIKVFPNNDSTLETLAGCRILAKPDIGAPLGLLEIATGQDCNTFWHFQTTIQEQKLFSFAANHMVATEIYNPTRYGPIGFRADQNSWHEIISMLTSSNLNVRTFTTRDIGYLLGLPGSPTKLESSSEVRRKWTVELWRYINREFDGNKVMRGPSTYIPTRTVLNDAALYDHAIYRSVADPKKARFLTPREFETLPCIVRPKDAKVVEICSRLSGLMVMDPACLPLSLASEPENQPAEFARLLGALEKLERSKGISAKLLLESALKDRPREPLQELLKVFLKGYETAQDVPRLSIIKQLPIWPRLDRPGHQKLSRFLSAEDAIFCLHSNLFVSWAGNVQSFVDPSFVLEHSSTFQKLGLRLWTPSEVWSHIKSYQPKTLADDDAVSSLEKMLDCLFVHNVQHSTDLSSLALDGTRTFRNAHHLYDDQEPMFEVAFRHEADKHHLHPKLRKMRSFWRSVGLRMSSSTTGEVSEQEYVKCATAVDRNQVFDQKDEIVGLYIEYERHESRIWSRTTWAQLSKLRLFPVVQNALDMPKYRQPRMRQLADEHTFCSLQEATQTKHLDITWSRKNRLNRPPSSGVFSFLPGQGEPQLSIVYEHLQFLVGICGDVQQDETSTFVGDIKACYKFLQENAEAARSLPGIQKTRLWLNLDKTDNNQIQTQELVENFLPADIICLNEPGDGLDSLPGIHIAKKLLSPYVILLKALGCRKESSPIPTNVSLRDPSPTSKILQKLDQMRENSDFTDVVFEAQGKKIPAHKAFLTAASEKWHAQFSGAWSEYETSVTIPVEMDFKTLSALIQNAYRGTYQGPQVNSAMSNEGIVAIVNETLDVLAAADEFLMPGLHDQVEVYFLNNSRRLVRFFTVDAVLERASSANATRLRDYCSTYLEENICFVKAYREQCADSGEL